MRAQNNYRNLHTVWKNSSFWYFSLYPPLILQQLMTNWDGKLKQGNNHNFRQSSMILFCWILGCNINIVNTHCIGLLGIKSRNHFADLYHNNIVLLSQSLVIRGTRVPVIATRSGFINHMCPCILTGLLLHTYIESLVLTWHKMWNIIRAKRIIHIILKIIIVYIEVKINEY